MSRDPLARIRAEDRRFIYDLLFFLGLGALVFGALWFFDALP